jgi:Ni/Co efflux regulator RcnB
MKTANRSNAKKSLLALATAVLLAGAAGSASAQQSWYDRDGNLHVVGMDYNRDGIPDRVQGNVAYGAPNGYYGNSRYVDSRYGYDRYGYDRYANDGYANDRDCDGVPNRYDQNDRINYRDRDCDGVPNGYDLYDNRGYTATRMYSAPRYYAPSGYTYNNRWNVGSRLPSSYYGSRYYIDYRPYGLAAPPYGYRWNRVGNDAYLVSTANGLIGEIVYSLFR